MFWCLWRLWSILKPLPKFSTKLFKIKSPETKNFFLVGSPPAVSMQVSSEAFSSISNPRTDPNGCELIAPWFVFGTRKCFQFISNMVRACFHIDLCVPAVRGVHRWTSPGKTARSNGVLLFLHPFSRFSCSNEDPARIRKLHGSRMASVRIHRIRWTKSDLFESIEFLCHIGSLDSECGTLAAFPFDEPDSLNQIPIQGLFWPKQFFKTWLFFCASKIFV